MPRNGRTIMKTDMVMITAAVNGLGQRHLSIRKMFTFRNKVYITNAPSIAPYMPRIAYNKMHPRVMTIRRMMMFLSFWEKTGLFIQYALYNCMNNGLKIWFSLFEEGADTLFEIRRGKCMGEGLNLRGVSQLRRPETCIYGIDGCHQCC